MHLIKSLVDCELYKLLPEKYLRKVFGHGIWNFKNILLLIVSNSKLLEFAELLGPRKLVLAACCKHAFLAEGLFYLDIHIGHILHI